MPPEEVFRPCGIGIVPGDAAVLEPQRAHVAAVFDQHKPGVWLHGQARIGAAHLLPRLPGGGLPQKGAVFHVDAADHARGVGKQRAPACIVSGKIHNVERQLIEDLRDLLLPLIGRKAVAQELFHPGVPIPRLALHGLQRALQRVLDGIILLLRKSACDQDGGHLGLQVVVSRGDLLVLGGDFLILPQDLLVLGGNLLVLLGDLPVFHQHGAQKDRHQGRSNAGQSHEPVGARPLLALPQLVKGAAHHGCIEPHDLLAEGPAVDGVVRTRDVGRKRLGVAQDVARVVKLVEHPGRKALLRLAVNQHRQKVGAVVGLQEIADLLLAPPGLGQIRRADHDQILGVIQGVGDAVRQARGRRQLVLVAKHQAELACTEAGAQLLGHGVGLDAALDALGSLLVQRLVAVADKGDIVSFLVLLFRLRHGLTPPLVSVFGADPKHNRPWPGRPGTDPQSARAWDAGVWRCPARGHSASC